MSRTYRRRNQNGKREVPSPRITTGPAHRFGCMCADCRAYRQAVREGLRERHLATLCGDAEPVRGNRDIDPATVYEVTAKPSDRWLGQAKGPR